MSYVKFLKKDDAHTDHPAQKVHPEVIIEAKQDDTITEAKKPEELLRGAGFKIRLVTPTSFGTQIDLAKSYNPDEITKVLIGFNLKFKDKSVFIVN
jgi:hypothetical protein